MAKKKLDNIDLLYGKDYDIATKFANIIFPEFNSVIKSIVYFGSGARKRKSGDVDVLIILMMQV